MPRWLGVGASALLTLLLVALLQTGDNLSDPTSSVVSATILGGLILGVGAQIYRFLKVSGPAGRRQTGWVVGGLVVAILGQIAFIVLEGTFPSLTQPGVPVLLYEVVDLTGVTLAYFLIPLGLAAAMLSRRLWGIELLVNRALVYGILTATFAGGYALFVGAAGLLVETRGNPLVAMLATGLAALLFQPLRSRLQRGANRLLYGDRDNPYLALARLGRRLEATLAPDAILPSVVQAVAEALRVPYAAIALRQDGELVPAAAVGTPVAGALRVPLRYGSERVGELVVGPRAPGEPFGAADRRLLEDLARQVGVAAHAASLTAALRRSRERVVTAREEERRRLRRDLHDGLGPALASQTLKAGVARALLAQDPAAA
ncbi:MAG: histidine kinase [Chloroflexota bacterium]|nr:histidine kinase [Chloroflexota bacterium]